MKNQNYDHIKDQFNNFKSNIHNSFCILVFIIFRKFNLVYFLKEIGLLLLHVD
jgi:hypothetical protein